MPNPLSECEMKALAIWLQQRSGLKPDQLAYVLRAIDSHDALLTACERAELSTTQIRLAANIGHKSAKSKVTWYVGQLEQLGRELRVAITLAEQH